MIVNPVQPQPTCSLCRAEGKTVKTQFIDQEYTQFAVMDHFSCQYHPGLHIWAAYDIKKWGQGEIELLEITYDFPEEAE